MIKEVIYKDSNGTKSLWRYDEKISKSGPIEVIEDYKAGDESKEIKVGTRTKAVVKEKLPKTKMKYLNPATGKMVGYVRAKNLGLI